MIQAYCDGASRGHGQTEDKLGEASFGVVVFENHKEVLRYGRGLGRRTNNEAEYEAVLCAVLMCAMADLPDPIVYSDSMLVVNHINDVSICKTPSLIPLYHSVKLLQEEFPFTIQHVPRRSVWMADEIAKHYLDLLTSFRSTKHR